MPLHHRHNNIGKRRDNKLSQHLNPGSLSVFSASSTGSCYVLVRSTCQDDENSEHWNGRIQDLVTELQRSSTDETTSGRERMEEDLVDAWLSEFLERLSSVEDNVDDDFMNSAHDSIEITKRQR
jgi:hypothetical protein